MAANVETIITTRTAVLKENGKWPPVKPILGRVLYRDSVYSNGIGVGKVRLPLPPSP